MCPVAKLRDQIAKTVDQAFIDGITAHVFAPAKISDAVWADVEPVLSGWMRRAQAAEAKLTRVQQVPVHEGDDGTEPMEFMYAGDVLEAIEAPTSEAPSTTTPVAEPLIDPDCRDGKCGSCVGGPCECPHHSNEAVATDAT
jgi:hypothetical protein